MFTGGSGHFLLTEAYGTVSIYVTYYDPQFPNIKFQRVVKVRVEPGPAHHLVIEGSPDSSLSLRNDNPLEQVTLALGQTTFDIYATLRDEYGNYISHASQAAWVSFDQSIVRVAPGNEPQLGEGTITRVGSAGQTRVSATQNSLADTITVLLEGVPYDQIRIVGADVTNDTLRLGVNVTSTLTALGHRANTSTWDTVEVRWDGPGITLSPSAPPWASQWIGLSGATGDTGQIIIRKTVGALAMADTITVIIRQNLPSNPADHLVIEGSLNWAVSPTQDNPIDTVRIPANVSGAKVYAIIRDQYGTYYDYSRVTTWVSRNTNIVSVADGLDRIGEGIITRVGVSGSTIITATNTSLTGLSSATDSTVVLLLGYAYDSLRIVVNGATPISQLLAQINVDTMLTAQGRKPDGTWETVQVRWSTSTGLAVDPAAPERATAWNFLFTSADSGWVEVTLGDSIPLRTRIIVVAEQPQILSNYLTIEQDLALATQPGSNPVDTIKIARNDTTALVYAVVRDRSNAWVRFSNPTVWTSLDPTVVSVSTPRPTIGEAVLTRMVFNGADTTKVIAYDVLDDLTKHADTVVVILLNYTYSQYQILVNGIPLDSVTFPIDSTVTLTLVGLRSDNGQWEIVPGSWDPSNLPIGVIPPGNSGTWSLNPGTITGTGNGVITVTLPNGQQVTIHIVITPDPDDTTARITDAVTRDIDGDGYLDQLDLTFSYQVTLPAAIVPGSFTVSYNGTVLTVDSIVGRTGTNDSQFTVYIREYTAGGLQTDWTPRIALSDFANTFDTTGFVARDGAGPVTSRAVLSPGSGSAADTLRVYFSERVTWPNTNATPADLFNYYASGTLDNNALAGIPASAMTEYDTYVVIVLTNGFDVQAGQDSIQLKGGLTELDDMAGNAPPANGRKAPIEWGGRSEVTFVAGPNPFVPGVTQLPPQTLSFYAPVLNGATSGIIVGISSMVALKETSIGSGVYGKAVIYDAVGNLVRDNVQVRKATGEAAYGAFWDGRNGYGRVVGSGAYLCVLSVTDINNKTATTKRKLGVQRK